MLNGILHGYTYASISGSILVTLEEKYGKNVNIAILDTDSHHGNGPWDVTFRHHNILYVCFCNWNHIEDDDTKICIDPGYHTTDRDYLTKVKDHFIQ
ncbi:MAG: hypothetical protein ACFFD2_17665 [Promethearchaeota archaeon]